MFIHFLFTRRRVALKQFILVPLWLGWMGLTHVESAQTQSVQPSAKPASSIDATRSTSTKPLLKSGSQGEAVSELQAMLKLLGFYTGSVTGVFDEPTASAVTKFQKAANISADGVVGSDTWDRLLPPTPPIADAPQPKPTPVKTSTTDSFPSPRANPAAIAKNPAPTPAPSPKPNKPAIAAATGDRPASTTQESATLPILRIGMKGPAVEGLQQRLRTLGFLKGAVDGVFGTETQSAVRAAQKSLSLEPDGVVGQSTWLGLLR